MYILSVIYGFISGIRNKLYDLNIFKSKKVEGVKIICIGNITAGGTGKTPAVQYFAEKELTSGKKTGILSRGYKGIRKSDPFIVRDEEKIYGSAVEAGDESYLHALNLKTPVVVSKDRYTGAKLLKEKYNVDIIIMDDGYQHRKLYRDKNILLIDALNPFGGGYFLPKGRLRESMDGINRADEIIITKTNYVDTEVVRNIENVLEKYKKPVYKAIHRESYFYNQSSEKFSLEIVKEKKIFAFSSIANPENLKKSILKLEPESVEQKVFPDHHIYSETEQEELKKKSEIYDYVVTTEKDIVKIGIYIENMIILKIDFEII